MLRLQFQPGEESSVTSLDSPDMLQYVLVVLNVTFAKRRSPLKPTAVDDPWILVQQFKQAAINAKEAGFDGVECQLSYNRTFTPYPAYIRVSAQYTELTAI